MEEIRRLVLFLLSLAVININNKTDNNDDKRKNCKQLHERYVHCYSPPYVRSTAEDINTKRMSSPPLPKIKCLGIRRDKPPPFMVCFPPGQPDLQRVLPVANIIIPHKGNLVNKCLIVRSAVIIEIFLAKLLTFIFRYAIISIEEAHR